MTLHVENFCSNKRWGHLEVKSFLSLAKWVSFKEYKQKPVADIYTDIIYKVDKLQKTYILLVVYFSFYFLVKKYISFIMS